MCPDQPVPNQGLISRGYSYTLQKNNGESWDLTDSAGNKLTAPAVCFMIPPTDPEALALADRYGIKQGPVWGVAVAPLSSQAPFTGLGTTAEPQGTTNVPHMHPLWRLRWDSGRSPWPGQLVCEHLALGTLQGGASLQVPVGLGMRNSLHLHVSPPLC